jgi:hypothetical protein
VVGFQNTYGGLGIVSIGGGGTQGTTRPKSLAVMVRLMASFCGGCRRSRMLVDLGAGDGRVLVVGSELFGVLVGTETGGEIDCLLDRYNAWRQVVGGRCDSVISLYRNENDIKQPASHVCVAVYHFHQTWNLAEIRRVRRWLPTFGVDVYVSIAPSSTRVVVSGYEEVFSLRVTTSVSGESKLARVFRPIT